MKSFIHLRDFSKEEIKDIFALADRIKADGGSTILFPPAALKKPLLEVQQAVICYLLAT